jgi:hypothetical protein
MQRDGPEISTLYKKAVRYIDGVIEKHPDLETLTIPLGVYIKSIIETYDPRNMRSLEAIERVGIDRKYVKMGQFDQFELKSGATEKVKTLWDDLENKAHELAEGFVEKLTLDCRAAGWIADTNRRPDIQDGLEYLVKTHGVDKDSSYSEFLILEKP